MTDPDHAILRVRPSTSGRCQARYGQVRVSSASP